MHTILVQVTNWVVITFTKTIEKENLRISLVMKITIECKQQSATIITSSASNSNIYYIASNYSSIKLRKCFPVFA